FEDEILEDEVVDAGTQQTIQSMFDNEDETQRSTYYGTQQSTAYGPSIGDEEDPPLRPKILSEKLTKLKLRKSQRLQSTENRRIPFMGDDNGVCTPTNLPYSPTKTTWKGKAAITLNHLEQQRRKNIKIMGRKGK
ncbi:hypothetical protein A4A49_61332, partial [Nicotiana attenuata]